MYKLLRLEKKLEENSMQNGESKMRASQPGTRRSLNNKHMKKLSEGGSNISGYTKYYLDLVALAF